MRILDLFSGIGGFSLGLERAGMRTVAFCEIEPYPRAVLRRHWPHVPCFTDVSALSAGLLEFAGIAVDVICGGFPCQDISYLGDGAGLDGARSGLWREYWRLISEIRPQYVIVENVSALLTRGLSEVLADLAAIGFDAEWHCIPAAYVGAPHRRDRIWIIAYPAGERRREARPMRSIESQERPSGIRAAMADTEIIRWGQGDQNAAGGGEREGEMGQEEWRGFTDRSWWQSEPDVGRVGNGIPNRSHRLRALGNAVVPQVVEVIGRAIMRERPGRPGLLRPVTVSGVGD